MTEHDVTRLPVVARADCALLDLVTPAPVASGAAPGPTRGRRPRSGSCGFKSDDHWPRLAELQPL